MEGNEVVAWVRLVLEVERLLADPLLAVGRRKDAAHALDGRRAAVPGHDPAPDDALHLVVADPGHVLQSDIINSVTIKKSPNVYKSCPKLISLEK